MAASYAGLRFVPVLQDATTSQRTKELARSAARSHAAIITHQKKRATKRKRVVVITEERPKSKGSSSEDEDLTVDSSSNGDLVEDIPVHLPSTVCLELLAPNTFAVHQVFRVSVFWHDCWLQCMSNETFCSAFWARIKMCRDAFNDIGKTYQPSKSVLKWKMRAIKALQIEFAKRDQVDELCLLAMIQLGLLEGELKVSENANAHLDAVSRVLKQRIEQKNVHTRIRPMLEAFIMTRAMETNFPRTPNLPFKSATIQGPILKGHLANLRASETIRNIPSGFASLAKNEKLSIEILQVIERIVQLRNGSGLSLSPNSSDLGSGSEQSDETKLAPNFWTACPSLTSTIKPNEEPEIDNLLALGLWLYAALEFSNRPIPESMLLWISISRSTRQELSTRLVRCINPRSEDEEECLMWLFEIAIASWTNPDGSLHNQGTALVTFRMCRFRDKHCPFDKFFEFTKRWPQMRDMIDNKQQPANP